MPVARGGGSRTASPPASGAMISSAGAARGHRRGLHLARRQNAGLVYRGDRGRRRLLLLNMRSTQHANLHGRDREAVGLIARQLGGESRGAARDRQNGGGDRQNLL